MRWKLMAFGVRMLLLTGLAAPSGAGREETLSKLQIVCRAQTEHSCAMKAKVEKHGSHRRRQITKTAMVRLRIPQERKDRVEEILHLLGLTPTQVVNILFAQIVAYKAVPFRIGLPSDDATMPIEHVAKVWNSLDDTDYSYLNDSSPVKEA
jgi:DNA-damage-inducible protein J